MTDAPGFYEAYAYRSGSPDPDGAARARVLRTVSAVLGLIVFGISFAAPVASEFAVWLSVLAAAVASVGLLPRQSERGWLVAVLALTGFLASVRALLAVDDIGWAISVIVVLSLLQAASAVVALLFGGPETAESAGPDYSLYDQYLQAYQAYAQYQQAPPVPQYSPRQEQASARAHGVAAAQAGGLAGARADAAQESYEAMRMRYQQQAAYPQAASPGAASSPVGIARSDPGIPHYGQAGPAPARPSGMPVEGAPEVSSN